jgi:hypothetical protein
MFRRVEWPVVVFAVCIALIGARPYAGSWNDGGRLATVESLVDHGTWAIDESIFVEVPADNSPYSKKPNLSLEHGTLDKLLIHGRYYSDKSPVPNLFLAGVYKLTQIITGLKATRNSDWFCWWLTVCSSGLAYVVAVWGMLKLLQGQGLSNRHALLLTVFFGLGTVALCYSRHVNQHIWLLAVAVLLVRHMTGMAKWLSLSRLSTAHLHPSPTEAGGEGEEGLRLRRGVFLLGLLTGLGYTIDMAAGPMLFLSVAGWLVTRTWKLQHWPARISYFAWFLAAALPWLALHHAIVYSIAGTIGPPGSVAAYLDWPGSPFNAHNITGHWQHSGITKFLIYCVDLLIGQKGFLGHNLIVFLAVPGLITLFRQPLRQKPELFWLLLWSAGTILIYAANSNNYSGECVSVRWFVPLLAPAFLVLGMYWRERPQARAGMLILGGWGMVWATICWQFGPWTSPPLWAYWLILALGCIHWWAYNAWRWYRNKSITELTDCTDSKLRLPSVFIRVISGIRG